MHSSQASNPALLAPASRRIEQPHKLRVLLVETTARGASNSMRRYGDLIAWALGQFHHPSHLELKRITLALSETLLERLPWRLRNWAHHAWIFMFGCSKVRGGSFDLVHLLDGSHGYILKRLDGAPTIVTAHDLIPLLHNLGALGQSATSRLGRLLVKHSMKGLERANWIVADSENTRRDLIRHTKIDAGRIGVVHLAIPPEISTEEQVQSNQTRDLQPPERYVLHIGSAAFYKNRAGVLRIFALIRRKCQVRLKMVGPAPDRGIRRLVHKLQLENEVDFVVEPSDARLVDLYRQAAMLLFPSLYEGFGWPPLEAMSLGCPVVCSSAGSLPEVVGSAAMVAPVKDEQGLADKSIVVLEDKVLAQKLTRLGYKQARKFDAQHMALQLISVYDHVLKKGTPSQESRLPAREQGASSPGGPSLFNRSDPCTP